eukprot:scaffold105336_cov66-Phaeocystis_antarctica.AAC.4
MMLTPKCAAGRPWPCVPAVSPCPARRPSAVPPALPSQWTIQHEHAPVPLHERLSPGDLGAPARPARPAVGPPSPHRAAHPRHRGRSPLGLSPPYCKG